MFKFKSSVNLKEIFKLQDEIDDFINKTIYDIADQILAVSQLKVPVDKSTLKKSANIHYGKGYAVIGYNTNYAERIHDGDTKRDVVVPSHERKEHNRRTHGIIVRVKRHSVRTHIMTMPAIKGRPYMDDAIKSTLKKLSPEIRNMIEIVRVERDY